MGSITSVINLISSLKPLYKYGLFIIASLFLLYGVLLYDSARYNHGYNAAKLEAMETYSLEQSELESLFKARVEGLTNELQYVRQQSTINRDKAIELQLLLNNNPTIKEVVREIEVISNDCSDIPAYGRVLHNIIGKPPSISPGTTK